MLSATKRTTKRISFEIRVVVVADKIQQDLKRIFSIELKVCRRDGSTEKGNVLRSRLRRCRIYLNPVPWSTKKGKECANYNSVTFV